jgi:hypothetical protein
MLTLFFPPALGGRIEESLFPLLLEHLKENKYILHTANGDPYIPESKERNIFCEGANKEDVVNYLLTGVNSTRTVVFNKKDSLSRVIQRIQLAHKINVALSISFLPGEYKEFSTIENAKNVLENIIMFLALSLNKRYFPKQIIMQIPFFDNQRIYSAVYEKAKDFETLGMHEIIFRFPFLTLDFVEC